MFRVFQEIEKGKITLRLEGKLTKEYMGIFKESIEKSLSKDDTRMFLDFGKVSYIDDEMVAIIGDYEKKGVRKKNLTGFVRMMFAKHKPELFIPLNNSGGHR